MDTFGRLRRTLLASAGGVAVIFAARARAQATLRPWPGPPPAPPIELRTLDGRAFALADMRGKVVLVNFWATWCEPCIEELPSMQRLRDLLGPGQAEVLGVNYQEGEPRIRAFLKQVPLDFPIVRDTDGGVARTWNVRIFPTTFVVDADQSIRYLVTGGLDWSAPEIERRIRALQPR